VPLPIPNLDDKTFEALVSEARKLIALHAREWTDHNLSDPGITMVELFAWLTEMQLYSLNRIGDRHLLKYLKLLGTSPQPARPATVDVTFTGRGLIKKGRRVGATDLQTGESIVFETNEDLELTETELKKIKVYANYQYNDRTEFNRPNKNFFYAFGPEAKPGNAFALGFTDPLRDMDTLKLHFYLYDRDLPSPGTHDSNELIYSYNLGGEYCFFANGDETVRFYPSAQTRWTYGDSDLVVQVLRDDTVFFTRSGRVILKIDASDQPGPPGFQDEGLWWLRCEITEGSFEIPPRIERILLNTVAAVQGETRTEQAQPLWISSGLPGQTFETGYRPVIADSASLSVKGQPWEQRDDLDASGPGDRHYQIDWTKGLISFGDGINGMIPPKGEPISIVYRYGGGQRGNVMPLAVNRVLDEPPPRDRSQKLFRQRRRPGA
jgi:predicted phage baseplate assembly protein